MLAHLLRADAAAYNTERPLSPVERDLVVPFMRLTLLCNATWRFRNFNVVLADREDIQQEAKDSYKELADRIVALKQPKLVADIEAMVAALPPPPAL